MGIDLSTIEPFEVCSIRPPTENYSLTFRLTRNCYWNHCGFCPAYKFATRFSKRSVDEVLVDIGRAKRIDDLLMEQGLSITPYGNAAYDKVAELAKQVKEARKAADSAHAAGSKAWHDARPNVISALRQVGTELEKIIGKLEEEQEA